MNIQLPSIHLAHFPEDIVRVSSSPAFLGRRLSVLQASKSVFKFSNIRYATPPTGVKRFRHASLLPLFNVFRETDRNDDVIHATDDVINATDDTPKSCIGFGEKEFR